MGGLQIRQAAICVKPIYMPANKSKPSNYDTVSFEPTINYTICIYIILGQCRDVIMKSCNFWIPCWDTIPLANTKTPHVLHLSIIRPVFVGFRVAIDLQKRQSTVRSHESIIGNLL